MSDRIVLRLGNRNPQMQDDTGQSVRAEHLKSSVTTVDFPADVHEEEKVKHTLSTPNERMLDLIGKALPKDKRRHAVAIYQLEQILAVHSAGDAPAWVDCDDKELEEAVASYYACARGEQTMLLTNAGRDALHQQYMSTSTQPAAFIFGALSANTGGSFAASDTTLAGEITTASGGLVRASMTFAHTTGTNTSTLTHTWTANGSDSLPVAVKTWANFNAGSSGTMGNENVLSASATLSTSGDSLTVTFTLTAG